MPTHAAAIGNWANAFGASLYSFFGTNQVKQNCESESTRSRTGTVITFMRESSCMILSTILSYIIAMNPLFLLGASTRTSLILRQKQPRCVQEGRQQFSYFGRICEWSVNPVKRNRLRRGKSTDGSITVGMAGKPLNRM
ncbi:hypothetical protein Agabi119p4_9124 [Agaricus bisporus var. burnettii]|uniref:Uncharacterized protein n=1 Tax=Agaricus bisporus var. burnettii TaxID=192524 RepID=A0A8H7C5W7_AGABI|nr:hypothetical protein Agabi119p4_9124 [Agaricus bisporus var. burnettii]